jgi:hypothetical protein
MAAAEDRYMTVSSLERLALFHSTEAEALLLRFRQVENLIGPHHHAPSEGNYCEDLVRAFLRSALPGRLSVDTGFVTAAIRADLGEECRVSPQLDVIIHDTMDYAPLVRSGEFVVVLPDAVTGVIQVKKRLNSKELKMGLESLAKTRQMLHLTRRSRAHRAFSALFSFTADKSLRPQKGLSGSYRNRLREVWRRFPASIAIPDAIVVADEHIIYRDDAGGRMANQSVPFKVCRIPAQVQHMNVACQALLWLFTLLTQLPELEAATGRFSIPELRSEQIESFPNAALRLGDSEPSRDPSVSP